MVDRFAKGYQGDRDACVTTPRRLVITLRVTTTMVDRFANAYQGDGDACVTTTRRVVITRSVTTTIVDRFAKRYQADGDACVTMTRRVVITLRVMRRHAERDDYDGASNTIAERSDDVNRSMSTTRVG
jgi:hypothetical protein